jgi:hypothetical protein
MDLDDLNKQFLMINLDEPGLVGIFIGSNLF